MCVYLILFAVPIKAIEKYATTKKKGGSRGGYGGGEEEGGGDCVN